MSGDRTPQANGAERAILGAALVNASAIATARDGGLTVEDFGHAAHRDVFAAMCVLDDESRACDVVVLADALEAAGALERVGGYGFLAGLAGSTPAVSHLGEYVRSVREASRRRRLMAAADDLREAAQDGAQDSIAALDEHEAALLELRAGSSVSDHEEALAPIANRVYDGMLARHAAPNSVTGLPTGFDRLDQLLCGLQPTDLIILAARPAMGKSAWALNVVTHVALDCGGRVAIFSLEMGREQLATRILSSSARVSASRVRTGRLRDDDLPPLLEATEALQRADVVINDSGGLTLSALRASVRRMHQRKPLDLLVIDYLQLMSGDGRTQSREQEISKISRGLKELAKELRIPVLALSQLNRGVEQRADKRPLMSDLRESGAIEQDADVIMFLYRPEVYDDKPEHEGLAEVIVRKQRSGATGTVNLVWRGELTRFESAAPSAW